LPSPTGIAGLSLPGHPQAQVATGGVDRLYVIVPLSGTLAIAQGAIYTYYEFSPPRGRLLDESTWQQILLKQPPAPPAWAQGLYLAEGNPVDVLAFQVGDVLRLTQAAGKLNVRQSPDRFSKAIHQLSPGEHLDLIAGPQLNGGLVWWQVRITIENAALEGWVPQDPTWYERVY
jgi:hypothetical protein